MLFHGQRAIKVPPRLTRHRQVLLGDQEVQVVGRQELLPHGVDMFKESQRAVDVTKAESSRRQTLLGI